MGRSYNIQIEEKDNNSTQYDSSAVCFEITLEEYRHVTERANKFDNKVYIMITFCSIFFAFIVDLFEDISKLEQLDIESSTLVLLVEVYFMICFFLIYSLFSLILCLKPMGMKRFDPSILFGKSLYNKPSKDSYMVATKKYIEFINENNALLQKGYQKLADISRIMAGVVVSAFILKIVLFLFI